MSEHLSWIFSAAAIVLWIIALRQRRTRGAGANRRGRQPSRQPAANVVRTEPIVYFASDACGLPSSEYRFEYQKVQGSWRAYILKMPPLNGRSGAGSVTHRLTDGNRHFVCWDRPLRTLEDCQNVSRAWADKLQKYIATGERF